MKRYCLALDLKDDATLIAEYEAYHEEIWAEIRESIFQSGITSMDIYRVENRLFMIMETTDEFSFEKKQQLDNTNSKVQEWETLMWKFQQQIPNSNTDEKWRLMKNIFSIKQ